MPVTPRYYAEGPEALVVGLAARGDREAFTELVRRRQPMIRGLMRRFCGSRDLADDLAQKVFLKAWRRIRKLDHPDRFGAWIKRIAVNVWIDHQRKHAAEWNCELDDETANAPPASMAESIDLDAALASLPRLVRLCIVLSYNERLTHAEISELTGMPPGTIKSHIRRGSEKLRTRLAAYGAST